MVFRICKSIAKELHHPNARIGNVRSVLCRVLLVEVETEQVVSHTDKLDRNCTGPRCLRCVHGVVSGKAQSSACRQQ